MLNIDILTHFTEQVRTDRIRVFTLKDTERDTFLSKIPKPFRLMYITDEQLQWLQDNMSSVRADDIAEKVPTNPIIKSGEFGELLAFYLIPEKYAATAKLRPPKWRWKEARNFAAHFSDVVLFNQLDDDTPAPSDYVISVETKSRATRPSGVQSSLQNAIDDVETDFNGRLAESFFHIKTKYKDEHDLDSLARLERFMDLAKYPTFLKHFKAMAIVDHQYGDHHIDNIVSWPLHILDSFEVILVKITDMQNGYESTYINMLTT